MYLTTYNALSSLLWLHILVTVLIQSPHIESTARWTQTLALLDILHSIAGTYIASLPTNHCMYSFDSK